MIGGVLFDIDNTLVDTSAAMLAAAETALQETVPEATNDVVEAGAAIWLHDAHHRYEAYLAGELTFVGQRMQRVSDLFLALKLPDPGEAGARRWLELYRAAQLENCIVFADVEPCLQALAELPMGAVSNNDGAWQRQRLHHVGLDRQIGAILGIDDVGAAKPDPAMFHAGCTALGIAPEQVLYVGDSLEADARAATAAGLRGVWLDRFAAESGPEDVERITSLAQIPALLGR
ncbi:MAG TPA: HAD family hydrolase [Mycobacteriales bacterium]|nr:HAD family hydrolase [Mycobacteriales bacterium]